MKPEMKTYDAAKHHNIQWKYAHIKRDGHFLKVQKGVNDRLYCWTSNPNDITESLRFCEWFHHAEALPAGVSFLGELWVPGKRSEYIKTAIKEEDKRLQFDVFAIDSWRFHSDTHDKLQWFPLEATQALANDSGFCFIPFFTDFNIEQLERTRKHNEQAIEGWVLKNGNLQDWVKLKPRKTVDLIVTGFIPGTGKYNNMLGSLICETSEGYEVANVSGMTDLQRRWMTANTDVLLRKVIEVEYQNVGANGRLRHPAFVRTREDKEPNQCSVLQDDDLRDYWHQLPLFPKG